MRAVVAPRTVTVALFAAFVACGGDTQTTSPGAPPVTPTIAIGLSSAGVSVTPGQSASLTLNVTRTNFAGPVDLSVETLPNGVTATFAAPTLANGAASTSISITASGAATVGSFTLAIRARGAGVSDAVATLAVTIAGMPKNLSLTFCASDYPLWVATQSDQGDWVRALPDPDNVIRVAMGARGGVAFVLDGTELEVVYGSLAELAAYFRSCFYDMPRGPKTVSGVTQGFTTGSAQVALGPAATSVPAGAPFTLSGVLDGSLDLVSVMASQGPTSSGYMPDKVIVRRNQSFANNATMPVLDFGGSSAVALATGQLTVGGLSSGFATVSVDFRTATGATASTYVARNVSPQTYLGIPSSLVAPGDLHAIVVEDQPLSSSDVDRIGAIYTQNVVSRTLTLGPPVGVPTLTALTGQGPVRWRAQLASQSVYGTYVEAAFFEGTSASTERSVSVIVTAAYLGGAPPAMWDVVVPDLASAGFKPNWGMQSTATPEWLVAAGGGGDFTQFIAATDGATLLGSARFSSSGSLAPAARQAARKRRPLISDRAR
jgi:hypothetical protein